MSGRKRRTAVLSALVVGVVALLAPSAQASITPTLTLDQSAGTQAGGTENLGMDLTFAPANALLISDSPDVMTINLPPGLLANASIDKGACLTTTDLSDTNCQVGTGTVTAYPVGLLVPLTVDVTFDLVPPPAPGDLAGLAVNMDDQQIGSTAAIKVRPSGDPDGVGVTIDFVLPNSLDGAPIDITEIDSTFDGLRYPTSCPSTPANLSVSVNSYSDSTVHNLSQPLHVTGCSKLPYAPKLSVKVAKDSSDRDVSVTAGVTQAADEAPSKSLVLGFAGSTLGVNLASVNLICTNVASGKCTPVGVATAASPLYPKPLTANAYLTGTALGPTLTLVFPAPFPLTLVGNVTLTTRQASFSGLPDIPLTSLSLALNGGADSLFLTNCNPGSGTATGTSTDQNGDKKVTASVRYEISGCPSSSYTTPTTGTNSAPTLNTPGAAGLETGHPSLSFRISVRKKAPKLTALTVEPPRGLSFVRHRVGKRPIVTGVMIKDATIKSLAIAHGRLVIKLRKPATALRVKLTSVLKASPALIAKAGAGKVGRLRLTVSALNAKHKSHTVSKLIKIATS
jgi:hypothetical protein